jgi:hypothetical protein
MVVNKCVVCGKEFLHKRRSHKTCSKECYYKLLSEGKMGEKNPRFNNGWRQYHRMMADKSCCENCGRKYNLETHHKDGNNKNNNPDNLMKVCRRCHMLLDGRFKNLNYHNSGTGLCEPRGGG